MFIIRIRMNKTSQNLNFPIQLDIYTWELDQE